MFFGSLHRRVAGICGFLAPPAHDGAYGGTKCRWANEMLLSHAIRGHQRSVCTSVWNWINLETNEPTKGICAPSQ